MNIFGAPVSEAAVRPDPRLDSAASTRRSLFVRFTGIQLVAVGGSSSPRMQ
jgi:hypothetical protein